jgi:hypothetical protein
VLIINQQMFTTISVKTLAQLEKLKLALISLVVNITELISLATRRVSSPAAPPRLLLTRLGQ